MPIEHLLKDSKLKPDEIAILNRAFDYALRSLGLVDRNDPITEMVARKIIEVGATGVLDARKISDLVVKQLRT